MSLAADLVEECLLVTRRLGLELSTEEILARIDGISRSSIQLISTYQDILHGRETEMEFLNLEIARIAESLDPPVVVPRVAFLGRMIACKASLAMKDRAMEGALL